MNNEFANEIARHFQATGGDTVAAVIIAMMLATMALIGLTRR